MFPLILLPVQIVLIVLSALFVIISQCCGSKKNRVFGFSFSANFANAIPPPPIKAMEQFLKQENLDYQVQSTDFMTQANSLEDFFGKVVVDNIVQEKKVRLASDHRSVTVDLTHWAFCS